MKYLSQKESQEIDNRLIEMGYSITSLIEIAGLAAFDVINSIIEGKNKNILVIIGPGNNGADGLVIARWLKIVNHKVTILYNTTKYVELLDLCSNLGVHATDEIPNQNFDFIVDAVFGFSFSGNVIKDPYLSFLRFISGHERIISIDVPSGYEVDSYTNENYLFQPYCVICLVGPKMCCKGIRTFVARAFVPREMFYDEEYTNYVTFTEIKREE